MNGNFCWTFLALIVVFLIPKQLIAQETDYERLSDNFGTQYNDPFVLKNVTELELILRPIDLTEINELQITNTVERKLISEGIKVNSKNSIYLLVDVRIKKVTNGNWLIATKTCLKEKVSLERNSSLSITTDSWETFSVSDTKKIETQIVLEIINKQIEEFLIDWRKSNNKPSKENTNPNQDITKNENSPFTSTYIGENRPPEVEIFNDSDRMLYLDFGQDTLTPYTIAPKTSKKFTLTEGLYKYKANAPRVVPLAGEKTFEKGYRYTWRFVIITRKIN